MVSNRFELSSCAIKSATISVVIPTRDRPKHLKEALCSLLRQTRLPDEVIIVDGSDNNETEILISKECELFSTKKISIKYIREKRKGIALARNIGWSAASGTIVVFLDDDMILDKEYIDAILKVYLEHPNALGVQGNVVFPNPIEAHFTRAILLNCIRKVFMITHWEKDRQKVLPSGGFVFPYPLTKTVEAEVIFPSLPSFRREILKYFRFDEKLEGYSWGEEWFTLNISRSFPNSLYVTPFAKAIHNQALTGRPVGTWLYCIYAAYELYNFMKYLKPSVRNWFAYYWKCLGKLAIAILGAYRREGRTNFFYLLKSYLWTLRNFNRLKNCDFRL